MGLRETLFEEIKRIKKGVQLGGYSGQLLEGSLVTGYPWAKFEEKLR